MSLQLNMQDLNYDTVQNDHNIQHLMSLTVLLIIDDLARILTRLMLLVLYRVKRLAQMFSHF